MATQNRNRTALKSYFLEGVNTDPEPTMGTEIETSFVEQNGQPASVEAVQQGFYQLLDADWETDAGKGERITTLMCDDAVLSFELGRQNIELATIASRSNVTNRVALNRLNQLYAAMETAHVWPRFAPVLETDEDLLVIPDERDATWLKLDGRRPLNYLARCSSVQYTFSVKPDEAIVIINRLQAERQQLLAYYPQNMWWHRYIAESNAPYRADRYGGPTEFRDIDDYCDQLAKHDVIEGDTLVPFAEATFSGADDFSLFLRSIWWHFRLKRYGDTLCVEVRPLPRGRDEGLAGQLQKVLSIAGMA